MIPYLCGHYLRIGFDFLSFIDYGSSDGTYERLVRIARKSGRVRVMRVMHDVLKHKECLNAEISFLSNVGFGVVLPFDSDEFWYLSKSELTAIAKNRTERVIRASWTNFIQNRFVRDTNSFVALLPTRRLEPAESVANKDVTAFAAPFVGYRESKVGFVSSRPVSLGLGQHNVEGDLVEDCRQYEMFHLPLRARSELIKRGLNYEPRRTPRRQDANQSWQSAFHRRVVLEGRIDGVWAANSVNYRGQLDVYGKTTPTLPDSRFRYLMLAAGGYFLRTFLVAPKSGIADELNIELVSGA
jgi:hypothetical protein